MGFCSSEGCLQSPTVGPPVDAWGPHPVEGDVGELCQLPYRLQTCSGHSGAPSGQLDTFVERYKNLRQLVDIFIPSYSFLFYLCMVFYNNVCFSPSLFPDDLNVQNLGIYSYFLIIFLSFLVLQLGFLQNINFIRHYTYLELLVIFLYNTRF